MSGAAAFRSGLAAEACVARHYERAGCRIAGRRWRGSAGEIDLIARDGAGLIFIEVKKARSFGRAADRLGSRQLARICAAATEFLAGEPAGQLTPMRIDLALVDEAGRIEVRENVTV